MNKGRRRWVILALLFCATTMNYIDRQSLSVLAPILRRELHLTDVSYATIVTAFLIPYAVMYSLGGRLMDRWGARLGLALSFCWWSIATSCTGLARGPFSLGSLRALLGFAEPCVYPAGLKACTEFFQPAQRAMAMGIFSSGSAIGAVVAPPLVAWCTLRWGWQIAFLLIGLLALCWLPIWLLVYPPHPHRAGLFQAELRSGDSRFALLGRRFFRERAVWALILPRLFSDPVWYFYLFWLPDYLQRFRHLQLQDIALYGWLPFLFADFGNITGGVVSDKLIRRGWSQVRARLTVLVCVACIAPIGALVGWMPTIVAALVVICVVTFLTQCWTTNMSALAADLMPFSALGSVTGMAGTAGSIGGVLFAQLIGLIITFLGYKAAFAAAASLYPLGLISLLMLLKRGKSRLEPTASALASTL